jgi:hypothetical protein
MFILPTKYFETWEKLKVALITFKVLKTKTSGLYYKTFRIVIYDHNDSTIVEPVL